MYNCFFDDVDLNLKVRLAGLIEEDNYGYFIKVKVLQKDIPSLLKIGINPKFIDGKFILKVAVNNSTIMTFNGLKVRNFGNYRFSKIPLKVITLKALKLRRYSEGSKKSNTAYRRRECFAKRITLSIPSSRKELRKYVHR